MRDRSGRATEFAKSALVRAHHEKYREVYARERESGTTRSLSAFRARSALIQMFPEEAKALREKARLLMDYGVIP